MDILLVDDPKNAGELRNILEPLGHVVIAQALTGKEAIRKVKEISPDLIIINLQLKGEMGGVKTAGKINEYKKFPVIFLTSFMKNCLNKSWQLPEDAVVLSQPLTAEKVEYCIKRAVQ
ncbi:MAG TPA: response regulator [Methanobacterium sp.]|nr:response regulator [Methanobacterium sp.]